jgi:hypothetical protein
MPTPVSLNELDPAREWQPWQPSAEQPWNLKWAGHLFRRAAFGASLTELRDAVRRGLPATLDRLCQGAADADERERLFSTTGRYLALNNNPTQLRGWWMYRMRFTPHPLREKMTFFWHNHFATSVAKVARCALMYRQNELLRRHALGRFRPFLEDISRDPAMLVWLDSNNNVRGRANENYARELMELFTLGVGNYSERDVREAARAFTGWHTDGERFDFNERLHDPGPKTVLGQSGNWDGDDVLRICLEQPCCARFVVRKLYRFFISETAQPPDGLLQPLTEVFRRSNYDILGLVRTMISSRHFFSVHAYRQRVKSPAEFVIGIVRALCQDDGEVTPVALAMPLEGMGQPLFAPPNVKGWEFGRAWLNTATVVARHNFAQRAATGTYGFPAARGGNYATLAEPPPPATAPGTPMPPEPTPPAELDPAALVRREGATEPPRMVDVLAEVLLQGDLPQAVRGRLISFLRQGNPEGEEQGRRIRELTHALLTLPEYQLA